VKVPRQYPLVLPVKIGQTEGKAFGSGEGRLMRSGVSREVEQGLLRSIGILNSDINLGREEFGEILMLTWGGGCFRAKF
jgi:hypothetical protein